jgi:hypothetical protein
MKKVVEVAGSLVVLAGALVAAGAGCSSSSSPGDAGSDAPSGSSSGASSSSGSPGSSSSSGASSSGGSSSGSSGASSSSGAGALTWYFTCGDPVCPAPSGDGGLYDDSGAPCPGLGTACSVAGATCGTADPGVHCGAIEQCDTHDPTLNPGGCPVSSRAFKDGIRYVDGAELAELHDETLRLRLATYHYKPRVADPSKQHLGFIIEDTPAGSPAVDGPRDHVDLYGYMSMLVATMQVQEKEIADLRRELAAERAGHSPATFAVTASPSDSGPRPSVTTSTPGRRAVSR